MAFLSICSALPVAVKFPKENTRERFGVALPCPAEERPNTHLLVATVLAKGGTGTILMFWIGHLPWQHPFGPVPRGSCTQPLVLTAVSIFCLQTTQNPFLMNFFSCKSHLNDI